MIPTREENPHGLYRRYFVTKANGDPDDPDDPEAEYLVLRVDPNESDKNQLRACRAAAMTYAKEIAPHLPGLSADIILRYSGAV